MACARSCGCDARAGTAHLVRLLVQHGARAQQRAQAGGCKALQVRQRLLRLRVGGQALQDDRVGSLDNAPMNGSMKHPALTHFAVEYNLAFGVSDNDRHAFARRIELQHVQQLELLLFAVGLQTDNQASIKPAANTRTSIVIVFIVRSTNR